MGAKLIKCMIIRGGTSKGVFIERGELPPPGPDRDHFILALYGSPDKRQIDGLGGADKLTSKTAIMGPPTRPDCDIDYHFGQVDILSPRIDWTSNCGNISSGAAVYAVYKGYVRPTEPSTSVALHVVNTGRRLLATVPVAQGQPATEGDFRIGGVPGTGARINLDFQDFDGCILGRGILPTGCPVDEFAIPNLGSLQVSVVDIANLCIFVRAADVGMDNEEGIESLQANRKVVAMLESIRTIVATTLGLVSGKDVEEELRVRINPFVFVVGVPRSYVALNGEPIEGDSTDLFSRSETRWAFSKAYPGTGSIGTGVACSIPGTIPAEMVRAGPPRSGQVRTIRIGHPGGTLEVQAGTDFARGIKVRRATIARTARILMEGTAFVRV
jgi:2-methylaconitate cis-trans-isomerase PrpF